MKATLDLPRWLWWLLPRDLVDDHDHRIRLTGRVASTYRLPLPSWLPRVEFTVTTERGRHPK
jgi:hypothetical protein